MFSARSLGEAVNAADAAAAALCLGVHNPMASGVGGGALIVVREPDGTATAIYSGVGFGGHRVWRYYKAQVAGNSIKLYSAAAGKAEYLLEFGQGGKATVSSQSDSGIKVVPLERLDG